MEAEKKYEMEAEGTIEQMMVNKSIRYILIVKMNAAIKVIKLHNLQIIESLALTEMDVKDDSISLVKLPFYNFVVEVIHIFTQFTKSPIEARLNVYIVHYFMKKYQTPFDVYRHLFGLTTMWKKYVECHQEARELLSIIAPDRNDRTTVKLFLKIRKAILKNINAKIMQEISLNHQDLITLSHTIFTPEMKTFVLKKTNQLFISLKRKLLNSAKINGAVACEFLMNCAEKFQKQEFNNLSSVEFPKKSISKQHQKSQTSAKKIKYVEIKQQKVRDFDESDDIFEEDSINSLKEIENQLRIYKLNQKDQENHQVSKNKYLNFPKNHNESSNERLEKAKSMINKRYSNSWQKFIKTNQMMKQKLLGQPMPQ